MIDPTEIGNIVYATVAPLLEGIESRTVTIGNGHHAAQAVALDVEAKVRERMALDRPAPTPAVAPGLDLDAADRATPITDEQLSKWNSVASAASGAAFKFGRCEPEDGRAFILDCFDKGPSGPVHTVWFGEQGDTLIVAITGNGPTSEANAKHIAWSSPRNVTALIAEVRALRAKIAEAKRLAHGEAIEGDGVCAHELEAENLRQELAAERSPVDILLFCPRCFEPHVDAPNEEAGWANPPHRSHLCLACGHTWRPSDRATNGVGVIATKGSNDGPAAPDARALAAARAVPADVETAIAEAVEAACRVKDVELVSSINYDAAAVRAAKAEYETQDSALKAAIARAISDATAAAVGEFIDRHAKRLCEQAGHVWNRDDEEAEEWASDVHAPSPQHRRRLPPAPGRGAVTRRRNWPSLTEDLSRLEATDPAVADASRKYDEMCAKITARPLTDEERHATAAHWLARGLRALAGIEPIRTAPRRN